MTARERVWEGGFTGERTPARPGEMEAVARTSTRFAESSTLNFAVDLATPGGTQLPRLKGDYRVSSPQ